MKYYGKLSHAQSFSDLIAKIIKNEILVNTKQLLTWTSRNERYIFNPHCPLFKRWWNRGVIGFASVTLNLITYICFKDQLMIKN